MSILESYQNQYRELEGVVNPNMEEVVLMQKLLKAITNILRRETNL